MDTLVKKIDNTTVKVISWNSGRVWGNDGLVAIVFEDGKFSVEGAYDGMDKLWAVNFERKTYESFQQLCKDLLNGPICKTWKEFLLKGSEGAEFESLLQNLKNI